LQATVKLAQLKGDSLPFPKAGAFRIPWLHEYFSPDFCISWV